MYYKIVWKNQITMTNRFFIMIKKLIPGGLLLSVGRGAGDADEAAESGAAMEVPCPSLLMDSWDTYARIILSFIVISYTYYTYFVS